MVSAALPPWSDDAIEEAGDSWFAAGRDDLVAGQTTGYQNGHTPVISLFDNPPIKNPRSH
jgi:hypothetical protein